MVNFCSAFNCSSSSDVNRGLQFHKFPLKDKERLEKWIHAVKRKDFKPSNSSFLCSLHFDVSDYTPAVVSGKPMLKKTSIPSKFPEHLKPKIKDRRILQSVVDIEVFPPTQKIDGEIVSVNLETKKFKDIGVQTKLSGQELDKTLHDLRRDKRILQQKLMRRDKRASSMEEMLSFLKENNLIGETVEYLLKKEFGSSLPFTSQVALDLSCWKKGEKNEEAGGSSGEGSDSPF